MKSSELKEMIESVIAVVFVVFFSTVFIAGVSAAIRLSLAYAFIFYIPFLPLAYSFRSLEAIEKAVFSNILGIGYVGIYATLDVFLKIRLDIVTYMITTVVLLSVSLFLFEKTGNNTVNIKNIQ